MIGEFPEEDEDEDGSEVGWQGQDVGSDQG